MRVRQAERITGYPIRDARLIGMTLLLALEPTTGPLLYGAGRTENEACHELVERVYRWHCRLVDERAGYCCEGCGRRDKLQHHHQRFRARGQRCDAVDNLALLCWRCHRQKHQQRSA